MSDFPPRVENLRAMIGEALPEADCSVEEVWKSPVGKTSPIELVRFWRVSIQAGRESLPTVIDVPDKLVLESIRTASVVVTRSASLILRKRPYRKPLQ